jgi:hypothetical protein
LIQLNPCRPSFAESGDGTTPRGRCRASLASLALAGTGLSILKYLFDLHL